MNFEIQNRYEKFSPYFDSIDLLANLTQEERREFIGESRTEVMKRGESIRGDALIHCPIIVVASGVLSLQHLLDDGRKTIAAFFLHNDIIDLRNKAG